MNKFSNENFLDNSPKPYSESTSIDQNFLVVFLISS